MPNNKPVRVDQISLIRSIIEEINEQNNVVTHEQLNTIIKAANMICDEFNNKNSKKE